MFYIAIYTVMRISEILSLKREDIDFENKKIYVNKTLSHVEKGRIILENTTKIYAGMRDIPMINALYDKLIEYNMNKKRGFLFTIKHSDVNTYMLRHTFATRCIENGVNPVVLQKILGHKDIQVTLNTYTSVFNEFKENEIEKINAIF